MDNEAKEISNKLENVMVEIRGISVQVNLMKEMFDRFDVTRDIAQEALQSTKAAHHRIDSINKIIFWCGTTFVGSILVSVAVFITKGGLSQ